MQVVEEQKVSIASSSVIRLLLYYDLFDYPLTSEEIFKFSSCSSLGEINECLKELIQDELIFKIDEFYSVQHELRIATKRIQGNALAKQYFKKAIQRSKLMARFPFVKMIALSGSLSKNFADENTDVDFFVITSEKRLWLCRTLLILYKKIFLLNSKKYWCLNYFISEDQLEIPDHNLFTATELVTLIPLYNSKLFQNFISKNTWTKKYFPNAEWNGTSAAHAKRNFIKATTEKLLNGKLGDWLDTKLLFITYKRWGRKFPWLNETEFENQFRSTTTASKHHPGGFQFKVLSKLEQRIKDFEAQHELTLR